MKNANENVCWKCMNVLEDKQIVLFNDGKLSNIEQMYSEENKFLLMNFPCKL